MQRYVHLVFIAVLHAAWVLICYGLRATHNQFSSDFVVFYLPAVITFGLFGGTFYRFFFKALSRVNRISLSIALSLVCTVCLFFVTLVVGLNLFGV